jgi:hypothetical protein
VMMTLNYVGIFNLYGNCEMITTTPLNMLNFNIILSILV